MNNVKQYRFLLLNQPVYILNRYGPTIKNQERLSINI